MSGDPLPNRRTLIAALGAAAALVGLAATGFVVADRERSEPLAPADTAYGLTSEGAGVRRLAPDGRVLARAALPEPPTGLTLVPGAARAVAHVTGTNRLWSMGAARLDGTIERALGHDPEIVAPRPGRPHVAVAGIGEGALTLLDARDLAVLARLDGLRAPHDLRFDADGARLHVSLLDAPEVLTLDADTLKPLSRLLLPFPRGVDHMSATVDGRLGVAASPGEAAVAIVSLRGAPTLEAHVPMPTPVSRAYTGPRGDLVWLPSTDEPVLNRLDLATGAVSAHALPGIARGIVFEPFADTFLVLTDVGLARADRAGDVSQRDDMRAVAGTAIESAAGAMLLGGNGRVAWQPAHRPLGAVPLDAEPLFRVTGLNALSYCH